MAYQICIINPLGATLRTGPSISGGNINFVQHGDSLSVAHLVFPQPQTFDVNYIPAFLEALRNNQVRGDVWAEIAGFQIYKGKQVTGYVALRVGTTIYGALIGAVEPPSPLDGRFDEGFHAGEKSALEQAIQYLATERAKLN